MHKYTHASAIIDGDYRYLLTRQWIGLGDGVYVFIGLNPSTADALEDDPTIRRCVGFAERDGCRAIIMLNLFGYRATRPEDMMAAMDPVGPLNDGILLAHCLLPGVRKVIAAWGCAGGHDGRDEQVMDLLNRHGVDVHTFGLTKDGHPKHPLYLHSTTEIVRWTRSSGVSRRYDIGAQGAIPA